MSGNGIKMSDADLEEALKHDQARRIPQVRLRNDPQATDPERLAAAEGLAARLADASHKMGQGAPWSRLLPPERNLAIAVCADVLASMPADEPALAPEPPPTPSTVHAQTEEALRALALNGARAAHNLVLRAGAEPKADPSAEELQARVYIADAAKSIIESVDQAVHVLMRLPRVRPDVATKGEDVKGDGCEGSDGAA